MPATIEIKYKPVPGSSVLNDAQHLYVVYTNEAGEQRILRGGPAGSDVMGTVFGNIKVQDTKYDKSSIDWDENNSHPSQQIFSGTDAEMLAKINLARAEMNRINSEGYDYNLPFLGTYFPNTPWGHLNNQNSNTVAARLSDIMGLKSEVDNFVQSHHVNVPGYDSTLQHSSFDKSVDSLYDAIIDSGKTIGDFIGDLADNAHIVPTALARSDQGFINDLLNTARNHGDYDAQVNDFLGMLKNSLEHQLNQSLSNQAFSDLLRDTFSSLSRAESQILIRRTDPLTLDLNGNGSIDLIPLSQSHTFFDLDNDGFREQVGWVGPGDGILALDSNNNGTIDNIEELFGEQRADGSILTGTEELRRDYDSNHDGKIDINDAGNIYNNLKVWKDLNSNGISEANELTSLAQNNIAAINLNTTVSGQNIDGNVILSTGSYTKITGGSEGVLANLDLAINQTNSTSYTYNDQNGNQIGNYNLNLETVFLPLSRGYGNTQAWHIAMSQNPLLLQKMKDLVNLTNGTNYNNLDQKIEEFIYSWTNTSNINPADKRGEFSAQKLSALEAIRGDQYTDSTGSHNVAPWQLNLVQSAWGKTRSL